jgi:hypothetical protein
MCSCCDTSDFTSEFEIKTERILSKISINDKSELDLLVNFKFTIKSEIDASKEAKNKMENYFKDLTQRNKSLGIIPYIYKSIDSDSHVKSLEKLLECIEKKIMESCNHDWVHDVYEGPLEQEIHFRICKNCETFQKT